ncbi:MAG TPA: hypothetical protein VJA94_19120 [Candidatus Angelobacter sp.]
MKWNIFLTACCLLLLGFDVALLRQNHSLKAQVAEAPLTTAAPAGTQVSDLRGFDVQGRPLLLSYHGARRRKVLLFVFSPTCRFCAENWPNWWRIFPELNQNAVQPAAVDVTATATPEFIVQHQMTAMPVFVQVDPKAVPEYHFHLTPQTILVGADGKVEKVWSGVLTSGDIGELEKLTNHAASPEQSLN